jgi:hypothetical protein
LEQTGNPDASMARDSLSNSADMRQNMRAIIFIVGLSVALAEPAPAQTNQPASSPEATNAIPSDTLVTKSGTVYQKYYIERVDPAGLTVSYVPNGGGLGMEKVPFSLLPDDWQQRYKYDPEKAAKFDLEQKKAMAQMREQMIAEENAYREKRAQEEAAEEAAQKAAEEAAAAQATNAPAMTNAPTMTETNQPAPPSPSGGY